MHFNVKFFVFLRFPPAYGGGGECKVFIQSVNIIIIHDLLFVNGVFNENSQSNLFALHKQVNIFSPKIHLTFSGKRVKI